MPLALTPERWDRCRSHVPSSLPPATVAASPRQPHSKLQRKQEGPVLMQPLGTLLSSARVQTNQDFSWHAPSPIRKVRSGVVFSRKYKRKQGQKKRRQLTDQRSTRELHGSRTHVVTPIVSLSFFRSPCFNVCVPSCTHCLNHVKRCQHRNEPGEFEAGSLQQRTVLGVSAFSPAIGKHQHLHIGL